jgi:hypothetical protein
MPSNSTIWVHQVYTWSLQQWPIHIPLPAGADKHHYKNTAQTTQADIRHHQSLTGSLLYVQIGTRPNIFLAVSQLAQYTANSSFWHLCFAMRLCYNDAKGAGLLGYSTSSLCYQADDCHFKHIGMKYYVICEYTSTHIHRRNGCRWPLSSHCCMPCFIALTCSCISVHKIFGSRGNVEMERSGNEHKLPDSRTCT